MRIAIFISLALAVSACSTPKAPPARIIEVPSSKPYSFIRWSIQDTAGTKRAVRAHNRAHQAVIDAGKAAR